MMMKMVFILSILGWCQAASASFEGYVPDSEENAQAWVFSSDDEDGDGNNAEAAAVAIKAARQGKKPAGVSEGRKPKRRMAIKGRNLEEIAAREARTLAQVAAAEAVGSCAGKGQGGARAGKASTRAGIRANITPQKTRNTDGAAAGKASRRLCLHGVDWNHLWHQGTIAEFKRQIWEEVDSTTASSAALMLDSIEDFGGFVKPGETRMLAHGVYVTSRASDGSLSLRFLEK